MKKSIKIVLGIVAIIALASPYVVGRALEKDFNNFIARVNETGKNDFTMTGKFYRGVFSSTATTELTFKNSYNSVQLAHFIKHGPVIFNFNGWFSPSTYIPRGLKMGQVSTKFTGKIQDFIDEIYAKKPAYECITTIAFNGDLNTLFTNYPLTTPIDKGTLNWKGATANFNTDKNLEKANLALTMPSFEYTETLAPGFTQIANITNIKINFAEVGRGSQTTFKHSLESAKISTNGKEDASLQGLEVNVDKKITNGKQDLNFDIKFSKLAFSEDVYGPLNFNIKINNWQENALLDYISGQTVQMQLNTIDQPAALPGQMPTPPQPILSDASKATLLEALKQKVSIQTDLSFKTPDGDILSKISAEIGDPSITDVSMDQILPTLNIKENFIISKKLVYKSLSYYGENQIKHSEIEYYLKNRTSNITNPYTMTPETLQSTVNDWINKLIAQLTAQNYIVDKEDNFITDITYVNKIITINGTTHTADEIDQLAKLFVVIPAPAAVTTPAIPVTPDTTTVTPGTTVSPGATTTPGATTPTAPATITAPAAPPVPPATSTNPVTNNTNGIKKQ